MRLFSIVTLVVVALVATGCQRTSYRDYSPISKPTPLEPSPIGAVDASDVAPPEVNDTLLTPEQIAAQEKKKQIEIAKAEAGAPEVTKESLLGTWNFEVAGEKCRLVLSLTKWSGGYRAASRHCPDAVKTIAAWNLLGKQVVLNDRAGNVVARLFGSGKERFDGAMTSGPAVSLSR